MRVKHFRGFFIIAIALVSTFIQNNITAHAELEPSLTLHAGIQKDYGQEPGIVGLDMAITKSHYPVVQRVFRGTPAFLKGILPGDEILAINGFSTLGKNDVEIDRMISDVPGTLVGFKIQRGFLVADVYITVQSISMLSSRIRSPFANMAFSSYDEFMP